MTDTARIHSQDDEGLFSILHAAAVAAAGPKDDPVGVLEILPEDDGEGADLARVAIEAAYAHQDGRRIVYRLDVRTRGALDDDATLALARDALTRFGSVKFTNFCLALPAEQGTAAGAAPAYRVRERGATRGVEALDVTVYFPTRVPFYARNMALVADPLDGALRPPVEGLLDALGTSHKSRGSTLGVPAHQLRAALTLEQQLDALKLALAEDLVVTLYTSALPVTQAVRLELARTAGRDGTSQRYVDCCLSRGLRGMRACTLTDTEEMEQLVLQHFGVKFNGRSWRVANAHGEAEDLNARGVAGHKSGIDWPQRRHS